MQTPMISLPLRAFCRSRRSVTTAEGAKADSSRWRQIRVQTWLTWLLLCGGGTAPGADLDPVLVGQYPPYGLGSVQAIAISGGYAYVAFGGAGLQVLDIRNPSDPRLVGVYDPAADVVDVVVQGSYAYVRIELVPGFQVLDVSNPANPRKISEYRTDQDDVMSGRDLAVWGNFASLLVNAQSALSNLGNRIEVVDISDPLRPTFVGMSNVGGVVPDAAVEAAAHYVYLATRSWQQEKWHGHLEVIDINDPAHPQVLSACDLLTDPYGGSVAVSGNYAYVGGVGLTVVDISDPAHPRAVSSIGDIAHGYGSQVAVSGNLAVMGGEGLTVIDILDPANPRRVDQSALEGYASALALSGCYAYVRDYDGVRVIDISRPDSPRVAGSYRYSIGGTSAVAVAGNYVFVGGGRLDVIDVSNPAAPECAGEYHADGEIRRIRVSGNHAHVLANQQERDRYEVIRLSNPANPERVGFYEPGNTTQDLEVSGNYAYLVVSSSDAEQALAAPAILQVVDISDTANPRRVGDCVTDGAARDVAVSATYACVAGNRWDAQAKVERGYLHLIDIADPSNPRRVGELGVPGSADALALSDHYAFVGVSSFGPELTFVAVDISNPPSPRQVGSCPLEGGPDCHEVAVSGRYACVAMSVRGVVVIDISDPTRPHRVGRWTTRGCTWGVSVSGRYAYAADGYRGAVFQPLYPAGLAILDLENPGCLQRLGSVEVPHDSHEWGLAVSGSFAYLHSGVHALHSTNLFFHVIDTSDPVRPRIVGDCGTILHFDVSYQSVAVSGSYAFVNGGDLLNVIDVSDPAHPRRVREINLNDRAAGVAVSGDYVYLMGTDRARLQVFDAHNSPNLRQVGLLEMPGPGNATGLAILGQYAYLAGEHFQVIDISQPSSPRRVGGCQGPGRGWLGQVAVTGGRAYVVGDGMLRVFDTSEPSNPQRAGECPLSSGSGVDVAIAGDYAYVAGRRAGVDVFDVRDPGHPRRVGGTSAFDANALAIADGRLHVAAGDQGLVILNLYQPVRLESLQRGPEGFRLLLLGPVGQMMRVDRGRNLRSWEPFATVPIPASGQRLIDPAATSEPFLFYRAVSAP